MNRNELEEQILDECEKDRLKLLLKNNLEIKTKNVGFGRYILQIIFDDEIICNDYLLI